MAYTYKDFYDKATEKGVLGQYSAEQLETAKQNPEYGLATVALKDRAASARTPTQTLTANSTMQQVNKGYAVPDQPQKPAVPSVGTPFNWEGQEAYQQRLNSYLNGPDFAYDPYKDPSFAAYQKMYRREGDRATENALARSASLTGGTPSSWAVSAAAQAGEGYAAKEADIIPQLEKDAYQRYYQKQAQDLAALQAMSAERDFAYNMHQQTYQRALQAYQMGNRSPEILEILGLDPAQGSGGPGGGWSWNRWYADHGHKQSPGMGRPAVAPTNNYFDRYNDLVNGKIQ